MSTGWMLSADTHINEPPDLFTTRLPARLVEQAPRTVVIDEVETWVVEDAPRSAVYLPSRAGWRFVDPFRRLSAATFADDVPQRAYVPSEWLAALESDGVYGGAVFPSHTMSFYSVRDTKVLDAIVSAYNEWAFEFASFAPERIKVVAMLHLDDVGRAVAQLADLVTRGAGAILIPVSPPEDLPYDQPEYEPFWAAAAECGTTIALHVNTSRNPEGVHSLVLRPSFLTNRPDFFVRTALADMIFAGVFERHPKLRVVSVEHEGSWVLHFLERMDWHYRNNLRLATVPRFGDAALPSDLFKRSVRVSFTEDPIFATNWAFLGAECLAWGSDFPHAESTFPRSTRLVDAQLADVPAAARTQMTWATTAELYGFKMPGSLPAPVPSR